jgi:hypothetical protein
MGGFFAGLGAAWAVDRRSVTAAPREYRRSKVAPLDGRDAPLPQIAERIAQGRLGEAALLYFSVPAPATRRLLSPDDAMELAAWLRRSGHTRAALIVLQRHLRDFPQGPRRAEAHVAAGFVLLEDMGEPTAAYQHFLAALDLDPGPEQAAMARRGIVAIEDLQKLRIGKGPGSGRR